MIPIVIYDPVKNLNKIERELVQLEELITDAKDMTTVMKDHFSVIYKKIQMIKQELPA